jgi:acyl-CoA-dependent ceramide synthase
MRHFLNLKILWSILNEFQTVGSFELNWETEQYKCALSQAITLALLSALQALNLFWLFFILRIAYRFVFCGTADDDREEGEDDAEEEETPLAEAIASGEKVSFADAVRENGNGHVNGAAVAANGVRRR